MLCYKFWVCYTASHNFLQTTGAVSTLVILSSFMDTGGGGGCWQLVVLAVYTSTPSWPTFDLTYSISRQLLVATHHSQMQRCNLYFYSTFIGPNV